MIGATQLLVIVEGRVVAEAFTITPAALQRSSHLMFRPQVRAERLLAGVALLAHAAQEL